MMTVELPRDRLTHESHAKNSGVKNSKVYEWEKTLSSGGRMVYKRVKVNKKCNEDVYCFYKPYQRLFNAFTNKWDLCDEFNIRNKDHSDSDSDSDYNNQHYPENFVSQLTSTFPLTVSMNVVAHEDSSQAPSHS